MAILWFKTKEEKKKDENKELIHKDIEKITIVCDKIAENLSRRSENTTKSLIKNRFNTILESIKKIKTHLDESHKYLKEINESNVPYIINELIDAEEIANGLMKIVDRDGVQDIVFIRSNLSRLIKDLPNFKF